VECTGEVSHAGCGARGSTERFVGRGSAHAGEIEGCPRLRVGGIFARLPVRPLPWTHDIRRVARSLLVSGSLRRASAAARSALLASREQTVTQGVTGAVRASSLPPSARPPAGIQALVPRSATVSVKVGHRQGNRTGRTPRRQHSQKLGFPFWLGHAPPPRGASEFIMIGAMQAWNRARCCRGGGRFCARRSCPQDWALPHRPVCLVCELDLCDVRPRYGLRYRGSRPSRASVPRTPPPSERIGTQRRQQGLVRLGRRITRKLTAS
jgi:hypothetical protein